MARIPSTATRLRASVLLLVAIASGCTQLPTAQFTAYRTAFAQARNAGEAVTLDFSDAYEEAGKLHSRAAEGAATKPVMDPRFEFSVAKTLESTGISGDVAARLHAWQVITDYNDAMTRIAEGRSAAEVNEAAGGLIEGLRQLPIDALAKGLKVAAPYLPDVQQAFQLAIQEYERRRFVESVRAATPLIRSLLALLRADADNFYATRFGLYTVAYERQYDDARLLQKSMQEILEEYAAGDAGGPTDADSEQEIVNAANADLKALRGWNPANLLRLPAPPPAARRTARVTSEIGTLARQLHDASHRATTADEGIVRYVQVLRAYVAAIRQLDDSLDDLAAAASGPRVAPDTRGLIASGIALRQAIATYQAAKGR